ncbi:MAG TPA: fumarate hydratase [Candidatus Tripitaka californicus]|uniref:fumarate hydratase n=1 Tax=Candidatus Tripitaka californicus TaxID=3367616 RepID=UPI004025BDCC
MRQIEARTITEVVERLCVEANYVLGDDLVEALKGALEREEYPSGRDVLSQLIDNARVSRGGQYPACQDTGFTIVFLEMGQGVQVIGGDLYQAINSGVASGYEKGYLRASIVKDPLKRVNTWNNTPAVIHTELGTGDRLKITVMAKGGGCENMSRSAMLTPAMGKQGVVNFVVDTVRRGAVNACPPILVGVGVGGTFDECALISKKALLRPVGSPHPDPATAGLEKELLEKINNLGIGPQGLGGRITALAVHVEKYPCHIASLPVAVNMECHSHRVKTATL